MAVTRMSTNIQLEFIHELSVDLDGQLTLMLEFSGGKIIPCQIYIKHSKQKDLFSPFHSTKTHGIGLGLHIAKSTLKRINGTIAYQNRPEGGACFTVRLLSPRGESDE